MVNEQLVNWIKDGQAKGHSLDTLKSNLVSQGYRQEDVDDAVSSISNSTTPSASRPLQKKNSEFKNLLKKKKFLIPAVLLIVGIVFVIVLLPFVLNTSPPETLAAPVIVEEPVTAPIVKESKSITLFGGEVTIIELNDQSYEIAATFLEDGVIIRSKGEVFTLGEGETYTTIDGLNIMVVEMFISHSNAIADKATVEFS